MSFIKRDIREPEKRSRKNKAKKTDTSHLYMDLDQIKIGYLKLWPAKLNNR
jgi:hypothetical protein